MAQITNILTPFNGGTSYLNPDGTQSTYPTAPTVPPDGINWQAYDATQVNPVIDTCGYSFNWVTRTVPIKITKPGIYWLTFSANAGTGDPTHTGDGNGGGIDDVTLTALGSPYMSGAPTSYLTTVPVPAPQPDTSYLPATYAGYSIVADPVTPAGRRSVGRRITSFRPDAPAPWGREAVPRRRPA